MTSSDGGEGLLGHRQDRGIGSQNLPVITATGCRMPRSPSREKDFASVCSRSIVAQPPFAAVVLNRVSSPNPDTFFKRMSRDMTNAAWFEEENDLIKSCGALQSALGLPRSFSTSDIADIVDPDTDYWPADNDDIRVPRSASELAVNKLSINSEVLLMTTAMGKLGNTSRSLSTCVVVGDMASTSQLPSPCRYSGSLQNNCAPSAFSNTDLVRSVNKKVRQNYIQRRLLITYKTLDRLSHSEFNLDKTAGSNILSQQILNPTSAAAVGSNKFLNVPKSGKTLCPDDIAVCADTIKRYQPKPFTRYDRNMFIVNWLDNIDPQNATMED